MTRDGRVGAEYPYVGISNMWAYILLKHCGMRVPLADPNGLDSASFLIWQMPGVSRSF